jgi:hypothetical protein
MAPTPNNGTAAAALLQQKKDRTDEAIGVIDRDPEEAADKLAPIIAADANVGEITQRDMFLLMSQMQQQMAGMQAQIIALMSGSAEAKRAAPDTKAELDLARVQREATLKTWDEEPREPTFLHPSLDQEKIKAVTGEYPPHPFYVNGLMFPVSVGVVTYVPSSIARMVETFQHRRPYSGAPQGLPLIADPERAQFLAGSQAISIGGPGRAGEGRLVPDGLPPTPQPLGVRYDHNGQ